MREASGNPASMLRGENPRVLAIGQSIPLPSGPRRRPAPLPVDVMLVLLIIMMLIAPMLQQGVAVTLPEAGNSEPKPETQNQTVVAVDSANQFWVNGIQATKTDFATRVKSVLEDKTEKVVLIKGDKDAKYSAIMEAMDSLRAVGIEDTDP